ncbi:MAG: formylglycine-generating enzyme family protein, partial [Verrucomicrobiales bacterium]
VLNALGLSFPTEAEWEYGCRAGTLTPWWTGLDETNLWSSDLKIKKAANVESVVGSTTRVGGHLANAFGLHDVHGNVWEWCRDGYVLDFYGSSAGVQYDPLSDPYGSSTRVIRGGSYGDSASDARSARRLSDIPGLADDRLGLRPSRSIRL